MSASASSGASDVSRPILWFSDIKLTDVDIVGGKAASLGELYNVFAGDGIRIPNGFASTADAYHLFLEIGRASCRERV